MERKRAFCEDVLVRVCAIILAILIVFTGGIIFPEKSSFKTEEYEAGEGAFRFMWPESGVLRAEAETVTVTETKELTDVAYYDIWKHINGTWQFGKKQGSSVSSTFTIYIAGRLPEGAVVTSVRGSFDDGYSGAYSSYSVPSASISVKSFDNKNLTYSVSTTLNGTPMNLRQDSQSEYTEGYRYYIPAAFEVTYTLEKEVSDTDPDSGNTGDSGTGDEDNSANIDGEAILDLPDITYEGHSVKAEDRSIFDVDGESYGAARFYDEGYGSNKFTASGSSRVKRIDDTEAEVTFNSPGSNTVTLKVTTDSGNTLTDKEDIEVLRTPAILETLGGVQKENRRQVLTILVAENPSYPLTELWVEIEKKGGSERVHLDHDLSIAGGAGSGTNTNDNSTLVKTRAISDTGSDSKFTRVELEFLTKNTEEITMTYRIYAEDSRGNTDTVEKNFVVYPDMAPSVVIDSENPQFRDEGSNEAYVYAEDVTIYDGDDAERTWYVREEMVSGTAVTTSDGAVTGQAVSWSEWKSAGESGGLLMDASFGSWRGVAYKKTGVGKVDFRLDVKDKWVEGTLPEYVSESDIKKGSGTCETEVNNIAPVVSLTAGKMKQGSVLLLAREDEQETLFSEKKGSLRQKLLESGISTDIFVRRVKTEEELNTSGEPDSVFYLSRPYGYGVEGTFLEKGWYMVDQDTVYTVDATWTQNTKYTSIYYYDISAPYTIKAYDLKEAEKSGTELKIQDGGNPKWQITISGEQLDGASAGSVKGMAQDDTGDYLYFRTTAKTLVYDKESGSLVADIPIQVGDDNFTSDGRIYTLKSDGLYSINMRTGVINNAYPASVIMKSSYSDPEGSARRVSGDITFVTGKGSEIMRVSFDPETEEAGLIALNPSGADYASTYNIIGFGSNGDVVIGRNSKSAAHVFDRDGNEIFTKSGWSVAKEHDILPAYKSDGNFDYIVVLYNGYRRTGTSSSGYKYRYSINETLYDIRGTEEPLTYSYERVVGASGTTGCGTDAGKAMYAVQLGDIVVANTGNWSTCISDGSALSGYYNTSFTQMIFDTAARTTKAYKGGSTLYGDLSVGGVICEYGKYTDDYAVSAYSNVGARYVYGEGTNVQALRVARLPKTEEIAVAMATDKFAPLKSLVVCGDSILSNDEITLSFDEENFDDTVSVISTQLLKESESEEGIVISTAEDSEVSTITKTYYLKPDTEYFYELSYNGNLAEPVKVSATLERAAGEIDLVNPLVTGEAIDPQFKDVHYIVTDIESEDFSSFDEVNTYFTGIASSRTADGVYYGAALHRAEDSNSNRARSDSSSLSFTVPDGKKAILSFDYQMAAEDGAVDESYINIDDSRWYRNSSFSASEGRYTHPFILDSGDHTLSFGNKGYGRRPIQTYMVIDNLKVIMIEEADSTAGTVKGDKDEALAAGTSTILTFEDNREKGSFRTPEEIVSYAGQEIRYISVKPDAGAHEYMVRNDGTSNRDLTVNIPEDQKAVFTAITIASSPVEKRAVKWTVEGKVINVRYETSNSYYPISIAKSFRLTTDKSAGSIRAYTGNLYKVGAGFDNVEMVLTNVLNDSITGGKYYIRPENSELFFEDEVFSGRVDFSISGKGDWSLGEFRLYYIENGQKVYVEDGYMNSSEIAAFDIEGGEIRMDKVSGSDDEVKTPVYHKGETVKYDVSYFDYENDPSKKEYWRYTHVEANDGPHPDAGKILEAPITEFYIDGKYTVEHWQEDSTGRIDYDKESNKAQLTFYIEGAATAPWIETIKTNPRKPLEGDDMSISVSVNDFEKDPLELITEVYFEGKLVHTHSQDNITPNAAGKYPVITTDAVPGGAKEGNYSVVCTVKDELGTGFGFYDFEVEPGMKIEGSVSHFPAWEEKRLEHNEKNPDHPRSSNTYWANESFNLSAETRGNVSSVKVTTLEYPEKTVTLIKNGDNSYAGSFFDSGIAAKLAKEGNCDITFIFTATYPGGKTATDEVTVIIDDTGGSEFKIHRVW